MIAYLDGKITHKSPTYIIVDVGGVGYQVHISLYSYTRLESLDRIRIHTILRVAEDSHTLYGFTTEIEKHVFSLLVTVSGVGANTARLILSAMSPEEVQHAIATEQEAIFARVKGIGIKTAKRIILDLKDKILKTSADLSTAISGYVHNTQKTEALSALIALGFIKAKAEKVLEKIWIESEGNSTVEVLIKESLKQLS
ncbi:MAG: Holliday junction branch migration protein RuvA [Saprospiraceae bacterium]